MTLTGDLGESERGRKEKKKWQNGERKEEEGPAPNINAEKNPVFSSPSPYSPSPESHGGILTASFLSTTCNLPFRNLPNTEENLGFFYVSKNMPKCCKGMYMFDRMLVLKSIGR